VCVSKHSIIKLIYFKYKIITNFSIKPGKNLQSILFYYWWK